jgi:hypothetical protein
MVDRYMFFSADELRCHCGKCGYGQNDMDSFFMSALIDLRMDAGFPFRVYSAYRCPEWDAAVGGSGVHQGHGIDIGVWGHEVYYIISRAKYFGFSGIGIKQHGPRKQRFIHLDDLRNSAKRSRPRVWTYE